jgi:hypothetical protein
VPSQTEGAPRPSHFDRIDDLTAHCVSGTNLLPGNYPVGVAFPHPKEDGAFFRLVNLPTPRRRLEYDREVKTDEAARLAAISRRTLDRFLQEPRDLTESELTMLGQLDAGEVSRFAGRYFLLVDDKPLPDSEGRRGVGRASRFGWICSLLAIAGTKDAMPGLLEALDKHCFLPPTSEAPYRLHWLAALSIAARDPWPASGAWPDADAWLIGLIDNDEAILEGREGGPELGATAAGVLLRLHKQPPSLFGLLATPEPLMTRFRVDGYTFRPHQTKDDDPRQKVRQWWEGQREQEKQP